MSPAIDRPLHRWAREQNERRKREARWFIMGFWAGLIPGLLISVACVALALWLRG